MKIAHNIRLFIYIVLGLSSQLYSNEQQPFVLDRLYPENWYTKAREHCLLVWGTLDDMLQHKKHEVLPSYWVDASIGQLVFVKNCVHNIIKNNFTVMYDDIMHLSRIMGTIEERCTKLPPTLHPDKIVLLKYLVEKIKKKIEVVLVSTVKY